MDRKKLVDEQLKIVKEVILIDDIIGGDNLPSITIDEIKHVMKKYNISLQQISETLEDEELMKINDVETWVEIYNKQDIFLSIDVIDRMVERSRNGDFNE